MQMECGDAAGPFVKSCSKCVLPISCSRAPPPPCTPPPRVGVGGHLDAKFSSEKPREDSSGSFRDCEILSGPAEVLPETAGSSGSICPQFTAHDNPNLNLWKPLPLPSDYERLQGHLGPVERCSAPLPSDREVLSG